MDGPALLKGWRSGKGLSQQAASALIGVSQNTWSDWESGAKQPRISAGLKIAEVTEGAVPIESWLLADEQPAAKAEG